MLAGRDGKAKTAAMLEWLFEEWDAASPIARILFCLVVLAVPGFMVTGLLLLVPFEKAPVAASVQEATEPAQPAQPDLGEALSDPSLIENLGREERFILDRHFEAIGGIQNLSMVQSLRCIGNMQFADGGEFPIVVIKKHPNHIRLTIMRPEGELVMVSTPLDRWRCLWRGAALLMVEDLDQETAEGLTRSSFVVSELFLALQNSWTVHYIGEREYEQKPSYCFEVTVSDQHHIRYYIDPKSFLDIGREEQVYNSDNELLVTRTSFSAHKNFGQATLGTVAKLYENNEYKQTFSISELEFNPGVLPDTFERPAQDLLVKRRTPKPTPDS